MFKNILVSLVVLPLIAISIYIGLQTHSSKEYTFNYAGLERKYRIHYPKNFDKSKQYPLVIAIHGFLDDARIMELYTGLSRKADKEGFIVLYPYGYRGNIFTPGSWNTTFCCAWSYENNIDDLGFISKLLDQIISSGNINQDKIYAVGVSNGGMMASLLSLKLEDKISAIGTVASAVGAKYEEDENFTYLEKTYQPVPIIIIHGHKDKTIPFEGGASKYRVVSFTGAYDTLNFWLENNKCSKHPAEISKQSNYSKETYTSCENSSIEFYTTESKHTWPGSLHDTLDLLSGKSVNATDLIWDFFSRH